MKAVLPVSRFRPLHFQSALLPCTKMRHPDLRDDDYHLQHTTSLFRKPEQLHVLIHALQRAFPNGCPIYCYACSDGSEPYSIAILLIQTLGKKQAQKFFPIIARDISPAIIARAKTGYLTIWQRKRTQSGQMTLRNPIQQLSRTDASTTVKIADYFKHIPLQNKENGSWWLAMASKHPILKPFLGMIERHVLNPDEKIVKRRRKEVLSAFPNDPGAFGFDLLEDELYRVSPLLRRAVRFETADLFHDLGAGALSHQRCVVLFNYQMTHLSLEAKHTLFQRLSDGLQPQSFFAGELTTKESAKRYGFSLYQPFPSTRSSDILIKR